MIKIAITAAAFEAIARTLPLDSVAYRPTPPSRASATSGLRRSGSTARRDAQTGRELQRCDFAAGEGDDANEADR